MTGRLAYFAGLTTGLALALATFGVPRLPIAVHTAEAQGATETDVLAQQAQATAPLSVAEAHVIIDAAIARVREHGELAAAAVVDEGGYVVAAERMDGTSFKQVDYAIGKAYASAMQRARTTDLHQLVDSRPDRYFSILNMNPGKVYLVDGGIPLRVNGRVVGAVGVAGTPPGEDDAADEAGIAAWAQMRAGVDQ